MVVFSLRRWSSVLPSGFLVSRCTLDTLRLYSISCTGLLPSSVHLSKCVLLSSSVLNRVLTLHILLYEVWALPISLATTFGIVLYFLFLWVIRCFSSPGSPTVTMDLLRCNTTLLVLSSLIRISAVQRLFATTRSFSQLVTSFFGAMYQGILLYALCSLFFL